MRIVQYNDTYEQVGGTETYCNDVLLNLEKRGHDVYMVANGDKAPRADNHLILPATKGKIADLRSKYFFNPTFYQHFKNTFSELQPDVVHLHHNRYHTYELFKALAELHIPVVQTIHDYTILCPSQYYPQPYFKNAKPCSMGKEHVICSQNTCVPLSRRLFYPILHDKKRTIVRSRIATFIAPTTKIKSFLERANFKNVVHLPFYINPENWSFDANRTVKNTILFVGRVEENKGIHVLVNAVVELQQTIPDIQLLIIGKGAALSSIEQQIQHHQLSCIQLLGTVSHHEVKNYFTKANVCVVPTLDMEQFGLVGIEAMASGTAVIGSDRGGIPEWCIHEQSGLLFEPTEEGAILKSLKRMLTNHPLRMNLVRGGMELVKNKYTMQQHFEGLLDIYRNAKALKSV